MNKIKLIKYYDENINDYIFGSITINKYKTDCFKYCPYFRKRVNNLTLKENYKQLDIINDYKINYKKWSKDKNYKLFFEAFEIIKPNKTFYYVDNLDLKNKYDLINNFIKEIIKNTRSGAGMFHTYDNNLTIMKKIIEYDLKNFQSFYLFNYLFKQIINDIQLRIESFKTDYRYKKIWSSMFDKYLRFYYNLNWFLMF